MGNAVICFALMAKCAHGRSRQHPDLRQGGAVRKHQPRSALAQHADLDGEPPFVSAGIAARRGPAEAHDTAREPDPTGTGILQGVSGAAEPAAGSAACAHALAAAARRVVANYGAGRAESRLLPAIPV